MIWGILRYAFNLTEPKFWLAAIAIAMDVAIVISLFRWLAT